MFMQNEITEAFKTVQGKQVLEQMAEAAINKEIFEEMNYFDEVHEEPVRGRVKYEFMRGYISAKVHMGQMDEKEYFEKIDQYKKEYLKK